MNNKILKGIIGSLSGIAAITSFSFCNGAKEIKEVDRPNVILILTDDQGYGDLSIHGNPILQTPQLDKLHGQSLRFVDFHVAPMCTPTRGQLMSGRDAMDNGATAVCLGRSMIREELPTMADFFQMNGYQTAHFGKWHLGDSYPYRPQDRGFGETVHHGAWGIGSIADYYSNTYWDDTYLHNEELEEYEGYCTDVWFDLTKDYIANWKKGDKPFFVYLPTNCPHGPHLCDDIYSDPYIEKGVPYQTAKFFGQIANIDENVGKLLAFLDEKELADNTILIYMTDNGTVQGYDVFNSGMRGHKTDPYEGGHRVPFFIRWPDGNLGEPRDIDVLSQCQDVLPTLIDLCKLKKYEDADFDGSSLVPAIEGKPAELKDRILVVEYENPYRPKENKAVLWKNWRLVKDTELYDLSVDPGQENDVAKDYPEIVKSLQDYYQAWREKTMPEYNKKRYIHIGSAKENPLMLYSSDWQGSYADNKGNLFSGKQIGFWEVLAETPGKYEFTLTRWHPASGIELTGTMVDNNGKERGGIPIANARIKIGNQDFSVAATSGQKEVKFVVELDKGTHIIETWFLDKNNQPLCSAYYTKVELLD
jgi:arylsulfatase A-like enzyme